MDRNVSAIHLYVQWYDRKPDFQPDYDKEHHGTIIGDTPDECMNKLKALKENHDLAKYTRMEIMYIF